MNEIESKIVKYIKQDIDVFGDGQPITTYTEIVYTLKSVVELTEKEYIKKTKKI